MIRKTLLGLTVAAVAAGALLTPKAADAYWVRDGYGWRGRGPVVVVPAYAPGYYVGPYGRPHAVWIRAHLNRFGYVVPGHWR